MSYGKVFHKGCSGEFLYYDIDSPFRCNHCDAKWDGKDWSIAEYRPIDAALRKVNPS